MAADDFERDFDDHVSRLVERESSLRGEITELRRTLDGLMRNRMRDAENERDRYLKALKQIAKLSADVKPSGKELALLRIQKAATKVLPDA